MTKRELLENKAFKDAPMDAEIEIPNALYGENGDEREEVLLSRVRYWTFKNLIDLW